MTEENGHPDFSAILAGLKEMQAQLDLKADGIREQLDEVLQEKKSIDQMIAAAERSGKYGPRKKKGSSNPKTVSAARIEEIWQELQKKRTPVIEDIPGSFTALGLSKDLRMTPYTIRMAITALRDDGRVRLVGERIVGNSGRTSMIFVPDGD